MSRKIVSIFPYPAAASEIRERLRKFGESKFPSMAQFARALRITPQDLNHYLMGNGKPGNKLQSRLRDLGCDIEWLMTGKEPEQGKKRTISYTVRVFLPNEPSGIIEPGGPILREAMEYSPEEAFFMEVTRENGDSMKPVLMPGDWVLLGIAKKFPPRDGDIISIILGDRYGDFMIYHRKGKLVILTALDPLVPPVTMEFKPDDERFYRVLLIKKK
jgi:SOS-response transcriptional repressor LexA